MREKELRLALVCYGGISLAVYMHGITKEIWRLARASRGFHDGDPAATGSEQVYRLLLDEIAQEGGARIRVLPDIIAGASAGGINGIFLAQAIATGQSLEPLTELWLESADVEALIDPDAAPASRFSKAWALPLAWMAANRTSEAVAPDGDATVEEVRAKLSHFVRSRWFEPPFGGARFTGLLLDAFAAMATAPRGPRLLPAGQPLDLFVTVTDFTGHPERLALNSPAEVIETEHRLVLPFSDDGTGLDTLADPAELAFAARATSSFPGAFPPFTVGELDGVLAERDQAWPGRQAFLRRVLPRHFAAEAAERAVMIDGSVLANAPFRPAIDALRERPARREIDRRFVYIDPFPGLKFRLGQSSATPGFFHTILGAVSELPRQQPIRDNLEVLAERSARIGRMRAITTGIRHDVEREIEQVFGHTLFLNRPTADRLRSWRGRAQTAAADKAGYGYAAYGHLKLSGVVDLIATLLAQAGGDPEPQARHRIRGHVAAAVSARGLDVADSSYSKSIDAATITFLRQFDLQFRIRRLRLLARRLSETEAGTGIDVLDPLREAIYASLGDYLELKRTGTLRMLHRAARSLDGDAGPLLDGLAETLDLPRLDAETDARLALALARLPRALRRPMLLTYLGFPFFDVATLPLLQGEGLDEFDAVKVDRIAPDDAAAIRTGGAEATLKGIQFNSFGAFFSRSYRENDYLWGRLHGTERMIDILVSTLPEEVRLRPDRVSAIKRAAFLAILDEEEPRLAAIPALIAQVRGEIG